LSESRKNCVSPIVVPPRRLAATDRMPKPTCWGAVIAGASWEGFVVEQLIARAPPLTVPTFYRTSGGAEVDLVLDLPGGRRWLVEVKLGLAPRRSRGFHEAVADLDPERCFVVHGGDDRWAMDERTEAIGLAAMVEVVRGAG